MSITNKTRWNINYGINDDHVTCYTDGATVGHNGKLGTVTHVGLGVYCKQLNIALSKKVEGMSNNEAEFMALILGMETLLDHGVKHALFMGDSQIILNRANRNYIRIFRKKKNQNERMDNFQKQVLYLAEKFDSVAFKWIPRERNVMADALSKDATVKQCTETISDDPKLSRTTLGTTDTIKSSPDQLQLL